MTTARLRARTTAFGRIAARNGGNRAVGTRGYRASVRYVSRVLAAAGYDVRLQTFTYAPGRRSRNVIASLSLGGSKRVVMVGGHLDSVRAGPGVNDNGSGVAAVLEYAVQLARLRPNANVRFAFWGAEEIGLVGSQAYVESLSRTARARIALYLNLDMIGSRNFVRFVYRARPRRADRVARDLIVDHMRAQNLASASIDLAGRSDHMAFARAGIPVAGLFSGAEGLKTRQQARTFGGRAGAPYDRCYHRRCDGVRNVNFVVLEELADVAAHTLATFAVRPGLLR